MKQLLPGTALVLVLAAAISSAATRDAQWKEVDEAVRQGLPKTAIEKLEPILQGALRDRAYGEATKAIARRIVLEGNIQGNKPEEKITRLEAEIAKAPKEMAPLLDTILANWYWQYFQQNRWRFMQRTQTAQTPGNDFTTWDLPRLFAKIGDQFQKALANADTLKKTPVSTFDDLLEKGTLPDRYRPTLYDFIAQEALAFHTSGEQAAARSQEAFELTADGPIFDSVERFIEWKPVPDNAGAPTGSPVPGAIRLYQDLLRFHQNDEDKTAFLDVDLARFVYGKNAATGENRNERFKSALAGFIEQWADHELSALALYHRARTLQEEEDLVEARAIAVRGRETHPDSAGGKLCHNLIQDIESKSVSIITERVWNEPWPKIEIRYRNLTNVHFRAVPWDWNSNRRQHPENLDEAGRKQLLAREPALEWSASLPPTPDYKTRVETVPAPEGLRKGFHFIVASHHPQFNDQDNQVSYADIWVSDLAIVVRPRDGRIEGFVLNAHSGEPLAGAEVQAWHPDNQGNRTAGPAVRTDELGFFTFSDLRRPRLTMTLRARFQGDELATPQDYGVYEVAKPRPHAQTIFFTDRALYRPGQTIPYKGICLRVDQEKDDSQSLSGQDVTVVFADPNGKEIARQRHRCNDYGSFAGSFTAPIGRVTGRHHIRVEGGPAGAVHFNVEEYKRPKFQVTLDAPKSAPRLNDKVSLTGHATSYTGAAIDGAEVRYRIVREVRMPWWWGWGYWRARRWSESQEIAHGTARTETDGSFLIEFTAKPDAAVPESDEPAFHFQVYADVTDSTGETRSAQRAVIVGYTALQVMLSASDWQTSDKPVELRIATQTLDGQPQAGEGTIKVYRLEQPDKVQRPVIGEISDYRPWPTREQPDLSNPNYWELGEVVVEQGFATDSDGATTNRFQLAPGIYRVMLESQDRFGRKVTARLPLHVLDPAAAKLTARIPQLLAAPEWSLEPGGEFMALWGTGYDEGRAFIEIEHRHQIIQRFWTRPGQTQQQIKQTVTEAMRGGFTLHVTQVRENRAYLASRRVDVPWSNKELEITWEHFTSKLEPGQKETWTAVIKPRIPNPESRIADRGPRTASAERAVAEMVATLYDASLDAFAPLYWQRQFGVFRIDHSTAQPQFANQGRWFQHILGQWRQSREAVTIRYRQFPRDITANYWGYAAVRTRGLGGRAAGRFVAEADAVYLGQAVEAAAPASVATKLAVAEEARADGLALFAGADKGIGQAGGRGPDLSQVSARKNLNETAFFFPQLTSDSNGVVRMTFTMPEALTEWRFLGFAHDRNLRSGYLEGKTVTAKDIMVQPNPPRFLREGDVLEFTAKVANQSAARQSGKIRLSMSFAFDASTADAALGNTKNEFDFDIPSRESRSFSWRLKVPDGCGFLTYKAVASTGRLSDGEEGYLPVLSRRILLTESLPLPIRGPATKKFEFEKLLKSGRSKTLQHRNLVVQMVSNPSWYAVMALPYLMEFPHECTEQTFNRLYANALARHIAGSDPKIRRVFDQWKGTPALDSPLEKNQELKALMIEETPWLRQAQSESQARRNVGILFDDNRLNSETEITLQKLAEVQLPDGSWPWFPGGRGNDYITLYITTGFGRLRHLGADIPIETAVRSLDRLDNWMDEHYREIQKGTHPEDYVLSATDALHLYGRSFFLKDKAVAAQHEKAIDFFLGQARRHWLKVDNRQSQGHLAIALKRFSASNGGNDSTPKEIMQSIKERSVTNEEMGMFWRETELSWWWYRAPIETQALMIEAFDEVLGDKQAVEECRVWLLKQKQTQDWKTTKATADAVYALLLRGKDILASDTLVEVAVGGMNVTPGRGPNPKPETRNPKPEIESGTGFYERRFAASDIKPKLGEITVKKLDEGVAWGGVHWQYLEDLSKVTPHQGTPLTLKKSLYTKVNTSKGPTLEPVKGALQVGDELVVRVELRVDRDMEYAHLKDQRGSGTEPLNVLSGYRYQDGLAYYESTRDTASHFFIDYLPKGTYVFEYSTRVQHRGEYQTGVAEIQCMYAPEFNSHSESIPLMVR